MFLLLGVGLLAATALIMSAAVGLHHRPSPPVWTAHEMPAVLLAALATGTLTFGIGFLSLGIAGFSAQLVQLPWEGSVLLVAIPVGTLIASRVLIAPAYRKPSAEIVHLTPRGPVMPGTPRAPRRRLRAA